MRKKIELDMDEVVRLYHHEGKPLIEIAELFGVAQSTVWKRMKEVGIQARNVKESIYVKMEKQGGYMKSEEKIKEDYGYTLEEIATMYETKTRLQVAMKLRCSEATVGKLLKRYHKKIGKG